MLVPTLLQRAGVRCEDREPEDAIADYTAVIEQPASPAQKMALARGTAVPAVELDVPPEESVIRPSRCAAPA
jgi:hypothetical protein